MTLRHEMGPIEYAADLAREFGCNEIHVDVTAGSPILIMRLRNKDGSGREFGRYFPDSVLRNGRQEG